MSTQSNINNYMETEEDYLKKHLQDIENKSNYKPENIVSQPTQKVNNTTIENLHYFAFDIKQFPCGMFYPQGSTIHVRAAEVKEIQAYSMVDDSNYYDIVEKMNDMLLSCTRIKYPNGDMGTYMDLRDPDRFYLIYIIREITFQQGNSLATKVNCSCGNEVQVELKTSNFLNYVIPQNLKKFYNSAFSCFTFNTTTGDTFNLAPPTIGLQKAFTEYIIKENSEKKKPNMSFLKIIPFTLFDRTSITQDEIKSKLVEFQNMKNNSFQFLNSAVEKLTFGIEKVRDNCSCGLEVHSDVVFPNGPSAVFVDDDAFERFIKE